MVGVFKAKKRDVRYMEATGPTQVNHEDFSRKNGVFSNDMHDKNILSCVLEDLREINEWRRNVSNNVTSLLKEVDELKNLVRALIDRLSLMDVKGFKGLSKLNDIKSELSEVRNHLQKRMETLEFSIDYLKERVLDLEECLKSRKR